MSSLHQLLFDTAAKYFELQNYSGGFLKEDFLILNMTAEEIRSQALKLKQEYKEINKSLKYFLKIEGRE